MIIAGTQSGIGKTTISIGIMRALKNKALDVQPFKAGPDFIDPMFHTIAAGKPSINLDTFMMGGDGVKEVFHKRTINGEFPVIEGVMGLYDGVSAVDDSGSTAHLAKILDEPVLLVVDAKKMARSIAAIVKGFTELDRMVKIRWVVFNNVSKESHYKLLKDAVENYTDVISIGYVKPDDGMKIKERHLGLLTPFDIVENEKVVSLISDRVSEHLDMEALITANHKNKINSIESIVFDADTSSSILALAYDEAFCFYYDENIRFFERNGYKVVKFSPLRDKSLPANSDFVYIGGGYPELYAEALENNIDLRKEIKEFCESGGKAMAECGGLIFLSKGVYDLKEKYFDMCGVFPFETKMDSKNKTLGLREINFLEDFLIFEKNEKIRGHEFHYSIIPEDKSVKRIFSVSNARGEKMGEEGFVYKNTLATYVHTYLGNKK